MSLKHFTRETFEKELNGGALMLTTLASLFLFHERLSLTQWLGLALGAVATFLLCM